MPFIRVSMYKGRTKEQKVQIAREITEVMTRVANIPAEATQIIFEEIDRENWASAGTLASEK